MPGSKRRALKKLLSPTPTPVDPPLESNAKPLPPLSSTPQPPTSHASPSPSSSPHRSGSLSSLLHLGHHRKSSSSNNLDSKVMLEQSQSSIASDPANYMSDEVLQEDLEVEEMVERQNTIGTGQHRSQNGVPDLRGQIPHPQLMNGLNGHVDGRAGPDQDMGLMYAPASEQLTANELMFGSGSEGGKTKKSSKQRFEERQARKKDALIHSAPPNDPAWNDRLERERQEEIQVVSDACNILGRELHEIAPDGHCMFNAIADQLCALHLIPANEATNPLYTRRKAADYMLAHPDDFMPFLPSITGEDSAGATDDGMMTEKQFKKYCKFVAETGEWGGEPEIQALSRAFNVPIHVVQRGPPTIVSHGGNDDSFGGAGTPQESLTLGDRVVRISYHKRMYGLGEHYNSLRKAVAQPV